MCSTQVEDKEAEIPPDLFQIIVGHPEKKENLTPRTITGNVVVA